MFDCWSEIRKLKGRTLRTLAQKRPFDVLDVSHDDVLIMPHRNRNEITVHRQEIEDACQDLLTNGQITAREIQDRHSVVRSSFVSAFLAELPGVSYTLNPITLYTASPREQKPKTQKAPASPPIKPPESPQAPPDAPSEEPPKARFRDSASFGKRMEFVVIAELLRRGYDVYMTLVDDQQIDCILRQENEGELRYLDIQIKARSKSAKNPGTFAAMNIRDPRNNFYFIFYSEAAETYWIVPSLKLVDEARQNKTGANAGKYTVNFCNITKKQGVKPRPRFSEYQNAFHLLEWK